MHGEYREYKTIVKQASTTIRNLRFSATKCCCVNKSGLSGREENEREFIGILLRLELRSKNNEKDTACTHLTFYHFEVLFE